MNRYKGESDWIMILGFFLITMLVIGAIDKKVENIDKKINTLNQHVFPTPINVVVEKDNTEQTSLKSFFPDEYETIRIAALRNDCKGTNFLILLAIRKAENGKPGLEFGVMHPKAKNTNLDTQAGWAAATIVKNRERWNKLKKSQGEWEYKDFLSFIDFLGSRYCPPNSHKLNGHWVKNVKHWYNKFLDIY